MLYDIYLVEKTEINYLETKQTETETEESFLTFVYGKEKTEEKILEIANNYFNYYKNKSNFLKQENIKFYKVIKKLKTNEELSFTVLYVRGQLLEIKTFSFYYEKNIYNKLFS